MSALQEIPSPISNMQTSNFAHVIFQNVAKSYLPNAPLECHYTLTQYIHPHPKDWVGIFKVGWSTPRDYFTFLWSLMPEKYVAESTCNCVLTFQGYYLPNDDGEFYQFCYVTHKGEIRGASTPFQFRASSPVDELLTMEDEGHSDMLVVTTKTGLLELKIEKTMKEKEELVKITTVLEKEVLQLREHVEGLESEFLREQKRSEQLSSEREELFNASEILRNESDEAKRKCKEMSAKIIQLEEDIMLVTQKAIAKETELDSLKDKLKKVVLEKDQLECQLKYEKDEKDLYKVHLKNTEIENTKLLTEVQTLKNLDTNKENLISHYKEELGKLQICLADKEKMNKELLQNSSNKEDIAFLKQQLRKLEDQHQASRQEVSLMSRELSEAVNKRDKTMADLHSARLDTDSVRMQLADALAQLSMRDEQQQKSNPFAKKDQKATENQQKERELFCATEAAAVTVMKQCTPPVSPFTSDSLPEFDIREQVREMSLEMAEKTEKYRKCKQMLAEEKARCSAYADDVAKMELKWKEQLKVNDSIKRQLIALDDQYKVQSAEKDREICDLSYSIETLRNEKAKMERFINDLEKKLEKQAGWAASNTQGLQFFNPYCDEHRLAPAIPAQQPLLQFGNPYASQETRDGADGAFNPDEVQGPPVRATSWGLEDKVVCSQPARNLSRPDGLEDPDENNAGLITKDEDDDDDDDNVNFEQTPDPTRIAMHDQSGFCFEAGYTMNKKCPLCPVSFPPNYDQGQFEAHVESHWKVCPMCNEQFPPDCDQQIFERHVQTHFDGSVLNFD
uniref:Tax1-binding protein 1 homolog n=1 Tax=Xenopus tropicalis TaxID=8364 RepID=A0A6I8QXL2_XENTR